MTGSTSSSGPGVVPTFTREPRYNCCVTGVICGGVWPVVILGGMISPGIPLRSQEPRTCWPYMHPRKQTDLIRAPVTKGLIRSSSLPSAVIAISVYFNTSRHLRYLMSRPLRRNHYWDIQKRKIAFFFCEELIDLTAHTFISRYRRRRQSNQHTSLELLTVCRYDTGST